MDFDNDAISQLGGFALDEVLAELELDASSLGAVKGQLGLRDGGAFSRDSIYAGKFMDEADEAYDEDEDGKEDYEGLVDREIYDEQYGAKASTSSGAQGGRLMRGEEDDFDDEEEEEEEDAAGEGEGVGGATASKEGVKVKAEPMDEDDLLGGSAGGATTETAQYRPPSVEPIAPPPPMRQVRVQDIFPEFEYGKILDFTEMFAARPHKKRRKQLEGAKFALPATDELPRSRSTRDVLVAPLRAPAARESRLRALLTESQAHEHEEWEDEGSSDEELSKAVERSNQRTTAKLPVTHDASTFSMTELDDWESKIIWGPASFAQYPSFHLPPKKGCSPLDSSYRKVDRTEASLLAPRNAAFEQGDWLKGVIWDRGSSFKDFTSINLNLNDPQMLLEIQNQVVGDDEVPRTTNITSNVVATDPTLDSFNLSNDKEYEVTKDTKKRIRQTFGQLEVVHAYPAQKLQLPFYKTRLTKNDTRSFHRPALQFPQNIPLTFAKVRSSKKKKDKAGRKIKKSEGDSIRSMGDITCRDTSNFILWEYSEENPPIISNVGMGSIIVNYYRKREATDTFVPDLDIGEPLLLDINDESPFKAFGYVDPGQTVPTLYNNLVRAPLFRQKPADTDFLVVRNTSPGEGAKYFLREIKTAFVVGQTYPLTEVPGPHSRKITTLVKNRLQTIAFKLVAKAPHQRIKVQRLTRYFPDQNDLQMRQRLKEFMEFNRKGDNQGFWQIKRTVQVPDDAEMLKLATPELVCLSESMQVGLRHLQDAGYGQAEEGGNGDDDSKLDIEQQLAPWITTKNFMNAVANKAMLKLHGEGDPTGRGEAFSFLRVSMKDIFLRAGEEMATRLAQMENRPKSAHRYNVQEQQEVYKEEIRRIWNAQYASLSNPIEPILTEEDEERQRGSRGRRLGLAAETPGSLVGTPFGRAGTPGSRASSPEKDDGMSVASGRGGAPFGQNKVLRIRRLINGKWETEIVREPTIISSYVRQRQTIDDEQADPDNLELSDDESKNERRRKRLKEQLEKLKRNQERRLARKNQKLGIPVGAVGVGGKRAVKTETTRICGNCGQRGHMKTSKKLCPRWHEFNAPKDSTGASSTLASSFGGGLALPALGGTPTPSASAASPPPSKPVLKFKLGGGAGSPPAADI
ncbi:hypothetical protein T439DRAFT_350223 [Meredithblackwellia eburnea MCA 4105]